MSKVITASEAWLTALGQNGVVNLANTDTINQEIAAILPLTDCVVQTIVETGATGSLNGALLPAGVLVPGNFTSVRLTSGRCRLYLKPAASN